MTWKNRLISYASLILLGFMVLGAVQSVVGWWACRQAVARLPPVQLLEARVLAHRRGASRSGAEQVLLGLDVQMDWSALWHWTVRQIFVTVVAEWNGGRDRAVLWDRVLPSRNATRMELRDTKAKFPLRAFEGDALDGQEVRVGLQYMIMPYLARYVSGHVKGKTQLRLDLPTESSAR